jgi:hypothetical protein
LSPSLSLSLSLSLVAVAVEVNSTDVVALFVIIIVANLTLYEKTLVYSIFWFSFDLLSLKFKWSLD